MELVGQLQLFEHPQGAEGAGADAVVEVEHGMCCVAQSCFSPAGEWSDCVIFRRANHLRWGKFHFYHPLDRTELLFRQSFAVEITVDTLLCLLQYLV